jgi:hypothetical protein
VSILIYGPNQSRLTFKGGNDFLACLQTATNRRFADGRGYFLTMAGRGDDGHDVCISYWIHPSIPMMFVYDTEDETGEPPKTVNVTEDDVTALVDAMDRSLGVLWGFSAEDHRYLPFSVAAEVPPKDNAEG